MSAVGSHKRLTPARISAMKGGKPIVCLTAYTTPMARLLDEHCDLLLVGIRSAWCSMAWRPRSASHSI